MRIQYTRFLLLSALAACPLLLSACGNMHTEAVYPTKVTGSDKILYTDQDPDSVFGTPAAHPVKDKADNGSEPAENKHLWKAALDSVSSMPIASFDANRGLILTDWYENPDSPGQRLKFTITVHDRQAGADSVSVSVFRQVKGAAGWRDAKAPQDLATNLKNDILLKAGEQRPAN